MPGLTTQGYDLIFALTETELYKQVITALLNDHGIPWRITREIGPFTIYFELFEPEIDLDTEIDGEAAPHLQLLFPFNNSILDYSSPQGNERACHLEGHVRAQLRFHPVTSENEAFVDPEISFLMQGTPESPMANTKKDRNGDEPETSLEAVNRVLAVNGLNWNVVRPLVEVEIVEEVNEFLDDSEIGVPTGGMIAPNSASPRLIRQIDQPQVFLADQSQPARLIIPTLLLPDSNGGAFDGTQSLFQGNEGTVVGISNDYLLKGMIRPGIAQSILPITPVALDGLVVSMKDEWVEFDVSNLTQGVTGSIQWNKLTVVHASSEVISQTIDHTLKIKANAIGQHRLDYEVCDEYGRCSQATLTIHTIDPVSDPDDYVEIWGGAIEIDVLENDTEQDFLPDPDTLHKASEPQHGTVEVDSGRFVYTPPDNFIGLDSFTYLVTDQNDSSLQRTHHVHVFVKGRANQPDIYEAFWQKINREIDEYFSDAEPCELVKEAPIFVELSESQRRKIENVEATATAFRASVNAQGEIELHTHIRGKGDLVQVPLSGFEFETDVSGEMIFRVEKGELVADVQFQKPSPDIKLTGAARFAGLALAPFIGLAEAIILAILFNVVVQAVDPFADRIGGQIKKKLSEETEDSDYLKSIQSLLKPLVVQRLEFNDMLIAGRRILNEWNHDRHSRRGMVIIDGDTILTGIGSPSIQREWALEIDLDLRRDGYRNPSALDFDVPDVTWKMGEPLELLNGSKAVDLGSHPVWDTSSYGQADIRHHAADLSFNGMPHLSNIPQGGDPWTWSRFEVLDTSDQAVDDEREQVRLVGIRTANDTHALLYLWRLDEKVICRYRIYHQDIRRVHLETDHRRECKNEEVISEERFQIPTLTFGLDGSGAFMDYEYRTIRERECDWQHTYTFTAVSHRLTWNKSFAWSILDENGQSVPEVSSRTTAPGGPWFATLPNGTTLRAKLKESDVLEVETETAEAGAFSVRVEVTDATCITYPAGRDVTYEGHGHDSDDRYGVLEELRRRADILAAAAAGYFDRDLPGRNTGEVDYGRGTIDPGELGGLIDERVLGRGIDPSVMDRLERLGATHKGKHDSGPWLLQRGNLSQAHRLMYLGRVGSRQLVRRFLQETEAAVVRLGKPLQVAQKSPNIRQQYSRQGN